MTTAKDTAVPAWAAALDLIAIAAPTFGPLHPATRRHPAFGPDVWHISLAFPRWPDRSKPPWEETLWKTLIVGADDRRSVGEVEIVRQLWRHDFKAFWVNRFPTPTSPGWAECIADTSSLPQWWRVLTEDIQQREPTLKKGDGHPDIVAWKDGDERGFFIEYKSADSPNKNQEKWLRAARLEKLPLSSYAVARGVLS